MITKYTKLGLLMQQYGKQGGGGKVGQMLIQLGSGGSQAESTYQQQQAEFWKYINPRENYLKALERWRKGERSDQLQQTISQGRERFGIDDRTVRAQVDAAKKMLKEYQDGAKKILNPIKTDTKEAQQSLEDLKKKLKDLQEQRKKAIAAGDTDLSKSLLKQINQTKADIRGLDPNALKTTKTHQTEIQKNQEKINKLSEEYALLGDKSTEEARKRQVEIQKEIELLQKRNGLLGIRMEQAQGRLLLGVDDIAKATKNVGGVGKLDLATNFGKSIDISNAGLMLDDKAMKAVNKQLEAMGKSNIKQLAEVGKETEKSWRGAAGAMSAAGSALQGLEDPGAKIAGIVGQAIANIALGFAQATTAVAAGGPFAWIAAISGGLATMLSTISAIHSATGYAQGGIVDGRGGGFVGGMAYSGDNVGNVRLDSGELVLNRAQQNNLANALEGGNNNNIENRQPYVNGELIYLGLNNYLKRTGRGEIVVSKR
jgi:hypothetical protein